MEKRIIAAFLLLLAIGAGAKTIKRTVVFASSIECKNCCQKVTENVGFEKGVLDLKTDLDNQTITVVFNEAKTDTAAIASAVRKLGFTAKVVSFE